MLLNSLNYATRTSKGGWYIDLIALLSNLIFITIFSCFPGVILCYNYESSRMLYHLALQAQHYFSCFNVFHYPSFRGIAALLSTLFFALLVGNWFIKKSHLFRSKVREYTPETHQTKNYTPTMGGLFIIMSVVVNTLLWCNLCNPHIWIFLFCLVGFGAIGCWDDWRKINKSKGITAVQKFGLQWLVAGITAFLAVHYADTATTVAFPFFKSFHPNIGWLFIPWAMFIIVGSSNAVNLTDGLDGLAIGSLIPNFATFAVLNFIAGSPDIANYLNLPFTGSAELAVIGSILVGASLGFLWYNTYPAQIFMGDVGSLALGSGLAVMALLAKQELLLIISGGLFVMETLSVIMQVFSYRYFGKRLFKMAPLHHHFELLGWKETKITTRFGIISLILCLLALMTVKMR